MRRALTQIITPARRHAAAALMTAVAILALAPAAHAQTFRAQPFDALVERILVLEDQLAQERRARAAGQTQLLGQMQQLEASVRAQAAAADLGARLTALEEQVRRINGQAEQAGFAARNSEETARKRIEDFEFRLSEVERRLGGVETSAQAAEAKAREAVTIARSAPPAVVAPPVAYVDPAPLNGGQYGAPLIADATPTRPLLPTAPQGTTTTVYAQAPILGGAPAAPVYGAQTDAALPVYGAAPAAQDDRRGRLNSAVRLIETGAFDQARGEFETIAAESPNDPIAGEARFWTGETHYALGRYELAAKEFLDSFKSFPNGDKAPNSLLRLGMTLAQLGQMREACLTFTEIPNRYPAADPDVLNRSGIEARRNQCQ